MNVDDFKIFKNNLKTGYISVLFFYSSKVQKLQNYLPHLFVDSSVTYRLLLYWYNFKFFEVYWFLRDLIAFSYWKNSEEVGQKAIELFCNFILVF